MIAVATEANPGVHGPSINLSVQLDTSSFCYRVIHVFLGLLGRMEQQQQQGVEQQQQHKGTSPAPSVKSAGVDLDVSLVMDGDASQKAAGSKHVVMNADGSHSATGHKRPQRQTSSIYDVRSNKRRNAILFVAALATMIVPCRCGCKCTV